MKNYIFGYARVSTEAQNLDRQIDALKKYGVDMIYNEKMTGTKRDRPELTKNARPNDGGRYCGSGIPVTAGAQYERLD